MTDETLPQRESESPAANPSVAWHDFLIKYQHLLIAGVSILGLVWIWLVLQPPPPPAAEAMVVDGIEGRALPPPVRTWGGRRGFAAGDVVVSAGETLELFYDDPTGRNPTAPALISRDDRRRANAVLLLRVQPILRERAGVTEQEMQRIAETTRGLALNVSEADRAAIRAALDAGEIDRARLLAARAANTARQDFLDRTERAVQVLREVLPDERLEKINH